MPNPKHQVVIDALVQQLQTGGPDRKFVPNAVIPVALFPESDLSLDANLTTVYLVRPGLERTRPKDSGNAAVELEVFIVAATRITEPSENPYETDARWRLMTELVADVVQALEVDNRLGAPSLVVDVARSGYDTDFERYLPAWALAEVRLVIHYHRELKKR